MVPRDYIITYSRFLISLRVGLYNIKCSIWYSLSSFERLSLTFSGFAFVIKKKKKHSIRCSKVLSPCRGETKKGIKNRIITVRSVFTKLDIRHVNVPLEIIKFHVYRKQVENELTIQTAKYERFVYIYCILYNII